MSASATVKWSAKCPSHPDGHPRGEPPSAGTHECLATEMRCAYCGARIDPHPCNGCGKFLTAATMHEGDARCGECI